MNSKTCKKCGSTEFIQHGLNRHGKPAYRCKPCRDMYNAKNRARIAATATAWNKDNKDKVNASSRKWYSNNKYKHLAMIRTRQARKLKATPSWADKEDIALKYFFAKHLEEMTLGLCKYHVDHIIPLRGELVSGLHISANLQVLRAEDNLSKSNSFVVGDSQLGVGGR